MRTLLAIANDSAGSSDDGAVQAAVEVLRTCYEVALVRTATPDELNAALAAHPAAYGVVVLGGDGSLHAVLEAIRAADRLSLVVGLIPLGTGNDFAHALGLPDDPQQAAEVIVHHAPSAIDLIIDGDNQVVVNVAHLGLGTDAALAARPLKRLLGPLGYPAGALIASIKGLTTPGARLAITVDGEPLPPAGRVLQLAVGNGRFVGGGGPLLPRADPADGKLDIMIAYAGSRRRRIAYAWKLRQGAQHHDATVTYIQGSQLEAAGDPLPCTSDGELAAAATHHSWRIEAGALQIWR